MRSQIDRGFSSGEDGDRSFGRVAGGMDFSSNRGKGFGGFAGFSIERSREEDWLVAELFGL